MKDLRDLKPTTSILTLLKTGCRITYGDKTILRRSIIHNKIIASSGDVNNKRYPMSKNGLADAMQFIIKSWDEYK